MKFYKAGEIPEVPHMYFVYGDGGTGKTSLFKQFKGKKILFSFDRSTNPLRGQKDTDFMVIEEQDFANVQNLVTGFIQRIINSGDYDAIALDNVSSLQNIVLDNIDHASKDNRQNYQKLQLWFLSLIHISEPTRPY